MLATKYMLVDYATHGVESFVLWSGNSDFVDRLRQLMDDGLTKEYRKPWEVS